MYETELKSHFKFFLEDFFKIQNIDFHFFINNLLEFDFSTKQFKKFELTEIEKEWKRQILAYSPNSYIDYCDYYHLLIKILSFGTIGKILDANYNNKKVFTLFYNYLKRDNKFSIGKIFKDLETIIILRNGLCHKESLIIFQWLIFSIFLLKFHKKIFNTKNFICFAEVNFICTCLYYSIAKLGVPVTNTKGNCLQCLGFPLKEKKQINILWQKK